MLKIKLARFGKKHQPHYRIVVNEARDKRDGSYVASVGHYAPTQEPKILEIDLKAVDEWLLKGAQPTETVAALIERARTNKPFEKKKTLSKKAKARLTSSGQALQSDSGQAADAEKTSKEAPTAEVPVETASSNETPKEEAPKAEKKADTGTVLKEAKKS